MMTLYQTPGTCSLAPLIALHVAGLPHNAAIVDLPAHRLVDGSDYYAINPKGAVPTLRTEYGDLLTEVAVLLQYISGLAPDAGLIPHDGVARYRELEMINFVATEVHKGFPPPKALLPSYPVEAWNMADAKFRRKLTFLADGLGTKLFLTSDRITAADAYLYTILRSAMLFHYKLSPWPALVSYMERLSTHSAVRAALAEEGLD